MAATVQIVRLTGAGPTATDITSANTRASASDNPSPGSNNPLVIPAAGTNYSYWVTERLNVTVAPATLIDNVNFYTDGANGFGSGITVKGQTAASYVEATGTEGTTGDELSAGNHAGLNDTPSDLFGFTAGAPLSVAGSTSSTGQFGDYVVWQVNVGSSASPGTPTAETFSWSYDET